MPDLGRFHVEPQGPHFWIGKDLSRAIDEVDFYETARELGNASDAEADESFQVRAREINGRNVIILICEFGSSSFSRNSSARKSQNIQNSKFHGMLIQM